jgi:hypothetical protein
LFYNLHKEFNTLFQLVLFRHNYVIFDKSLMHENNNKIKKINKKLIN